MAHRLGPWLCLLSVLACGASGSPPDRVELTISAAASLREVITEAARVFEREHPDTTLRLNFAGSGALRQQIKMGAPVEVFISAASEHIDRLADFGLVDINRRQIFARNRLVLIGDRDVVKSLDDLTSKRVGRVAIGDPRSVPAGKYAREWLEAAGLWSEVHKKAVLAGDVRQVLSYVARGEVDAGIVYATDAKLLELEPILIAASPSAPEVVYEVAIVNREPREEDRRAQAQRFFDFLGSETVIRELEAAGFGAP